MGSGSDSKIADFLSLLLLKPNDFSGLPTICRALGVIYKAERACGMQAFSEDTVLPAFCKSLLLGIAGSARTL